MRQVSVDAVSSLLALIEQDGVDVTIPDLQDAFLEEDEARASR